MRTRLCAGRNAFAVSAAPRVDSRRKRSDTRSVVRAVDPVLSRGSEPAWPTAKFARMDRLSGLDALFLYGEQGGMHMHVCAVIIIDPSTVPGGYSFDGIKQTFANRMHL